MSKAIITAFVGVLSLSACNQGNSETPAQSSPTQISSQTQTIIQKEAPASDSISSEVANLFARIVAAIDEHPDKNAVDAYAKGVNWREYKPIDGTMKMLVANRIYIGKLAKLYDYVLIGSNGTNDRFSIAIFSDFDPQAFKDGLKGGLSLKAKPSNTSKSSDTSLVNKKFEMYDLLDGERKVGLLSMTYCTAKAIEGSGTVGFISGAYANKGGFLIPDADCRLK